MNWLKDNWFKLFIAITIMTAGISFGYYHFVLVPERESQEEQKQSEERFWKNKEEEIKVVLADISNLSSSTFEIEHNMEKALNELYTSKNDPQYYKVKPVIAASEHFLKTLDLFTQVIQEKQRLTFEIQRVIQTRDRDALDMISQEEEKINETFLLIADRVQKEQDEITTLKSEVFKELTI